MSRTSKVWVLKKLFEGEPKLSDFELEEHQLRDINDGGEKVFLFSEIIKLQDTTGCSSINVNIPDMLCVHTMFS